MDFYSAIRELLEEKKRLDRLITTLEAMENGTIDPADLTTVRRRGRKAMSEQERRQVSDRMKRYWATRRGEAESRPAPTS